LKCPFIIDVRDENGRRKEKALGTNDFDVALLKVREMVVAEMEPMKPKPEPERPPKTVVERIQDFFQEEASRGISPSTLKSFHKFLDGNPKRNPKGNYSPTLLEFATTHNIVYFRDFDTDLVTAFRQSWRLNGRAAKVQSERLKQFFGQAYNMDWIPTNPAKALKPPKTDEIPVVAFSPDEIVRILEACGTNEYLRTFNLVMRYSGLAIVDAVQLSPDRLEGSHLKLHRTKTGVWVKVLLPPAIVERLVSLPIQSGGGWFWNRKGDHSDHQTATGNMRRMLRPIFKAAKVYQKDRDGNVILDNAGNPKLGHPHQWRHTFVNALIIAGVSFERIAELLGDKISTVQDTYSHFVIGRQPALDEAAKMFWNQSELEAYRL
jgi:integrase